MNRLEVIGVTKRFTDAGTPAVHEASFTVEPGTIGALVGESGAGKSTLLRIIAGLEQPDAGEVRLDGQLLSDSTLLVPPERRRIGFVFQNHALFPHLDVLSNVTFGLRRRPVQEQRAEASRLLAMVRLAGYENRMPHELSGGERQRVALARTLAPRPGVVLLDEPFSSLDATLKSDLRTEMQEILRELRVTALLVTHDKSDALALADRITVIKSGHIQQTGEPADLYACPASRYVAAFFGECNFLPGHLFARLSDPDWGGLYRPEGVNEVWIRPANLQIVAAAVAETKGGITGTIDRCRFGGDFWELRFRPEEPALPLVLVHAPRPVAADGARVGLLPQHTRFLVV